MNTKSILDRADTWLAKPDMEMLYNLVSDMRDHIAGMGWRSVDTAPLMENIIVTYDGTDTFIGYFSDPKLRFTGGRYAIPYGQAECGCGTEEEFVLYWQPAPPKPENNDA